MSLSSSKVVESIKHQTAHTSDTYDVTREAKSHWSCHRNTSMSPISCFLNLIWGNWSSSCPLITDIYNHSTFMSDLILSTNHKLRDYVKEQKTLVKLMTEKSSQQQLHNHTIIVLELQHQGLIPQNNKRSMDKWKNKMSHPPHKYKTKRKIQATLALSQRQQFAPKAPVEHISHISIPLYSSRGEHQTVDGTRKDCVLRPCTHSRRSLLLHLSICEWSFDFYFCSSNLTKMP